jgi:hypothetical protein
MDLRKGWEATAWDSNSIRLFGNSDRKRMASEGERMVSAGLRRNGPFGYPTIPGKASRFPHISKIHDPSWVAPYSMNFTEMKKALETTDFWGFLGRGA